ncbi:acyltransferase family protein [Bacillus sp. CGMCC 1.16607]|uniref:acyltransferase family protein n=1 Tax=Bacillus sp. CGMCC 1.16607 TaxID=3351842 RepID=UPI00364576DE
MRYDLTRRYDIDWLRIIGICMLFPFHSARVFDHWDPFYVKSDMLSWGLSWFISLTNLWFMPLLFWLAGSASWYALRSRSNQQYVKDRFDRLFIPLIFGLLIIVPPQGYFARLDHSGEGQGSYFTFLKSFFTDFSDLSGYFGTFTPAHLWFILYLFVLSLIALPVFTFVKRKLARTNFHKILSHPLVFILCFFILVFTQVLPAPGGQNPFFYLTFLIMGFVTSSDQRYQEMFNCIRLKAFVLLCAFVPLWIFLIQNNQDATRFSTVDILTTMVRMLNVWLSLIVILGYGHKFLNFHHKWLPYLNEAAFPVYIIHQTVLVIVSYYVLMMNMGMVAKFICIMLLTFVLSILIYEFVIKRTKVTRWMFGVKMKNMKQRTEAIRKSG